MKKLIAALLTMGIGLSILFVGEISVKASPNAGNTTLQVVSTTKRVTRKTYHKGHKVTRKTWHKSKRISKRVWRKSNRIGHKTAHKTKVFVMGPTKRKP